LYEIIPIISRRVKFQFSSSKNLQFFSFIKSKYLDIEKEFVKNKNKDFTL